MINLERVGKKIMDQRVKIHMTQNELADSLYVTRQAVSKWEMGKSLPSMEVFVEITKLFHVTIDYLMDQSDLDEHDYKSMFMQYPRESVIYRFMNSNKKNQDFKNFFYLLSPNERKRIMDQVLSGQLEIDLIILWPCLSMAERQDLLGNLLSKEHRIDISNIYHLCSDEERMMIQSYHHNGNGIHFVNKIYIKGEK